MKDTTQPPVIDSHTHVWPNLFHLCEWDFATAAERDRWAIRMIYTSAKRGGKAVRRAKDDSVAGLEACHCLWDDQHWGKWEGLRQDHDFTVRDGRAEWTCDGVRYYSELPLYPGDVDEQVAMLDRHGVDQAVFQTAKFLTKFAARAMQRHPGRLLGTCGLDEAVCYEPEELAKLRTAVEEMGLRGYYYTGGGPGWPGGDEWHHRTYDPFWREIDRLQIPTYICGDFKKDEQDVTVGRLESLLDRFPTLRLVILHGLPLRYYKGEASPDALDRVRRLIREHEVCVEFLPLTSDFRGPELPELMKRMFELVGPERVVWGSELTSGRTTDEQYAERKAYIPTHADNLTPEELAMVMGGNLQRMFSRTHAPSPAGSQLV